MNLESEKEIAVNSVIKACRLCVHVQETELSGTTVRKDDNSPVTIADFGAQALIIDQIGKYFPDDPFVAEEDSSYLMTDEGSDVRKSVLKYVKDHEPEMTESLMIENINKGNFKGGNKGRFWTLDPIDGTKGFIRNDQYTIALALIREGEVIMGILGCPSLYPKCKRSDCERGYIFTAIKNQGAYCMSLANGTEKMISVTNVNDTREASFCESVESSHSSHDKSQKVAVELGVTKEPIRIDSQCKYGIIARGDASIYMRLPTRKDYREKIWDHAAGEIIVKEAGGRVTDCYGKDLDFSLGTKLENNSGIIATNGHIHERVLEAVGKVVD